MASSTPDKEALRPHNVFISYSRKDKEFVRRLDDALTARGRQAWVDWEGIRPTEEFVKFYRGATELDGYTISGDDRLGITIKRHKKRFNAATARIKVLWQPIGRIRQRIGLIEHVFDVGIIQSLFECFCAAIIVNEFSTGKAHKESLIGRDFQRL